MALVLIAALIAAATLGLLAWALRRRWTGMPQWSVPFAAAVGLVVATLVLEYTWYGRVVDELPPGIEVVEVEQEAMPLRPWTYLKPIKMRFWALDQRATVAHPQMPELRVVTLYKFARWRPVESRLMVVDCAAGRRVPLTETVSFTEEGELTGAEWELSTDGDGLQTAACRGG
jgi:type III secretory pathway component EscS